MLGGLAPDLSLYVLAGGALFLLGIPAQRVFDELYFSDVWQTVFAIDNSFLVWGAFCAVALWRQAPWAVALTGAALLHLALDMPLHHDDGRPHFWPVTGWVFESPVSYWDRRHGAMWIAPAEAAAALTATAVLWWRAVPIWACLISLILIAMEIWVVRQWLFFFVDG